MEGRRGGRGGSDQLVFGWIPFEIENNRSIKRGWLIDSKREARAEAKMCRLSSSMRKKEGKD